MCLGHGEDVRIIMTLTCLMFSSCYLLSMYAQSHSMCTQPETHTHSAQQGQMALTELKLWLRNCKGSLWTCCYKDSHCQVSAWMQMHTQVNYSTGSIYNSTTVQTKVHWQTLTLWPAGIPGSHTAADSMLTSRSCTLPMLSPMLSNPSWRSLRLSMCGFMSNLRTFPKLCRNCSTIRQSEKVLPGKTRPGIRDSSGSGWTEIHSYMTFIISQLLDT